MAADPDDRLRELEERVKQLETRLAEIESSWGKAAEDMFSELGRATAKGGRRAARAAEGFLNRGLDALRRNVPSDDDSDP